MKKVLSIAVLLLIGDAAAEKIHRNRHGRSYVQFLEGDFDDIQNQDFGEREAASSVQEAEKEMGKQIKVDTETMNASLDHYTKMNFDKQEGETFEKATSVADNVMLAIPTYYNPVPGVTMIQSDPIHGSLGEPKIKLKDLTPEQQMEEKLRRKVPVVFKDDPEQVTDTEESLKWAESQTGQSMPEYVDKKKMKKPVKYTLHDADDEEDDTVETRKSVKTAEKQLRKRFFINAKEQREYNQAVHDGRIPQKQITFDEDEDEELGPIDHEQKAKETAKKLAKVKAIKDAKAEKEAAKNDKRTPAEKAEDKARKEQEDEIAAAKEDRPDNAPPKPAPKKPKGDASAAHHHAEEPALPPTAKEAKVEAPAEEGLPPELAGALAQGKKKHSFAQQEDSDSDSDSDSSDDE